MMQSFLAVAQTLVPTFEETRSVTATQNDIISIAEARQLPLGTVVTVAGWITVTDEFRGPVYFQDETAGIAWFNGPLMREGEFDLDIAHGDSLVITGTLGEFGNTPGSSGDGLRQIVGNDVVFEIFPEGNREIEPQQITLTQLNTGNWEAQLITVSDLVIDHTGSLQGNTTYNMIDNTGDGLLRIDLRTDISGAPVPEPPATISGVAGIFRGDAQLLPRSRADLDADGAPGDDIPQDQTFDVVTWNIEWFGSTENGPSNNQLQFENVITVIETIDADIYTFQEIADIGTWNQLINALEDYSGIIAGYSQTQQTAFLYRNSTITPRGHGLISTGMNSFDWAGRLPLWFHFDVTINGVTKEVHAYGIHAKAFGDPQSYQRRVNASNQMKNYLDTFRSGDNIIFFGDFNDQLISSTWNNAVSPYANFVEDPNYFPVTLSLEEQGATSFRSSSMIDHIVIAGELIDDHIDGAQRVENTNAYIPNYLNTTSDHYPVWTRFELRPSTSAGDNPGSELPTATGLDQNYPNPFNPITNIQFSLTEAQNVTLTVYDVMGRRVATLLDNQAHNTGTHTVSFDGSTLSSGIYLYRLQLPNGESFTNKMMLVK
ncbi:MAG: T9SS type A sorting domain-containing protein [Balneolales bacterium]|nr:T9SS type A sorting domain-containing protein [Balneolales bacterium]